MEGQPSWREDARIEISHTIATGYYRKGLSFKWATVERSFVDAVVRDRPELNVLGRTA